jgi:putative PIN family toxin of toxin-antitoxin system
LVPGKNEWRIEVVSAAILDKIGRVLRYPKIAAYHQWPEERLRTWLENLAHLALMTPGHLTLAVIQDDPPDNRYLECAVEGVAAYLVSGDRLLLALGPSRAFRLCLRVRSWRSYSRKPGRGNFRGELLDLEESADGVLADCECLTSVFKCKGRVCAYIR